MADAVIHWNNVLLKVFRDLRGVDGSVGPISRGGAMMHGAVYDAVNSIAPSTHRPYLVSVPSRPGASIEAAIAHAAHDTLTAAFPTTTLDLAAERDSAIAALPPGSQIADGKAVGKAAAQAMIEARIGDGADDNALYASGDQAGDWRPTNSGPALTPNWGSVKPFGISAGNAFRPPRPGGYASKSEMLKSVEYAAQLNEVKRLGKSNSKKRTAEQTEIGLFWANDLDGTYKPMGQLFDITRIVSDQKHLDLADNARLFALVAMALADAMIVTFDSKYETSLDLWRPETAIRLAATDGNPATKADPTWEPLSFAPAFELHFSPPNPAHASGHAACGAAHAAIMRRFFGTDNVTFTASTEDPNLPTTPRVKRTFNSFTQAALENGRSRVYLGVHFQWDSDSGFLSGNALAEYVYDHVLTPIGA